jgi:O-antigen biosynthesis protein
MTDEHPKPPALAWTGERYVPEVAGDIRLEHVHRYLIARELVRDKHVLDIACGEGYGSAMLARDAAHVIGVDIAADAVAHAAERYPLVNVEFRQGACEAIPLPDQSVDVVVSFETIEHVPDHQRVLDEMRRVLRPGGLLIISTPDRREYTDVLGNRNEYHVSEMDRGEFDRLLRARFANVSLAGQRIRAGSLVGTLDGSTISRFLTFSAADADNSAVQGLDAPVYLLALASDQPLPALPVGLMDGGPFAWSADLANHLSQVQAQCTVELSKRLGPAVDLQGASNDTIGEVFGAQLDRVSDMAHLLGAYRPLSSELQATRQQLLAFGEQLLTANKLLTETQAALLQAQANERAHAAAAEAGRQAVTAVRSELAALHRHAEHLQQQINYYQQQVKIYEHSQSWRLTAPLRSARRHLGRLKARATTLFGGGAHAVRARQATPPSEPDPPGAAGVARRLSDPARVDFVPLERTTPVETRIKTLAFYLPQFHPIPENDTWWGKGFTEWRNVARGTPQFAGHYQPHLPGELGFYDLRVLDVQRRQIELARLHGIHGFCYHHYWFAGKTLLRRPLDQLLEHPELDFPFCLCWANENWTRTWDGLEKEVLIEQQHSPEDDLKFIKDIEAALRDPRYIRVGNRPLLIVYRPSMFPDAAATAERWREYCQAAGIGELFLASTHAFDRRDPREFGFDAALEFAPNNMAGGTNVSDVRHVNPEFGGVLYDYRELVALNRDRQIATDYPLFRCVTPMWDNEPRRPGRGTVFVHSSPALYREWLESACEWTDAHHGKDSPFVFVNAWNEWAEGAHLEPDQHFGYAYLEATAQALERFPARSNRPSIVCVSHDAYFHGAQLVALNLARTLRARLNYQVEMIMCGPGPLLPEFQATARVHDFSRPDVTRDERLALLRRLYDEGARVAICNTSVVGETAELLKTAGFSVVSLIHELPRLIKEYGLEASIQKITEHADKVVFPANVVRDKFKELTGLPPNRCVVQPQGLFAPNEFFGGRDAARRDLRIELDLPQQTRIVLAVGYADQRKGIDLFVDAGIRAVGQSTDDLRFVWVGHHEPAAFEQARAHAERAGMTERFIFPGPVRNSDLFLAGSDAYLMTSREDPFPSIVVQALDAGLPVIGFEGAGGFVELLERGCGILVPFCDTGAMADALVRVMRTPTEAASLEKAAREILPREFSFVNYTRKLVELVQPPRPRVSVVVPNFNYARYLPTRLKSIVGQTYAPHEILFLDDSSKDDSVAIAAAMLHASQLSYRIITNETNQGTYRQWLRGLREATGDLIWIAEADDDCSLEFLARMLPSFDNPDVMLAYCQSRMIDADGKQMAPDYLQYTSDISLTKWRSDYVRQGIEEIRDTLVVKNTIPNVSGVLMRSVDVAAIQDKLLGLKNAGDWLLYVHLLSSGSVAFVSEALNAHRRHAGSVTIGRGGLNLMREILMVQQFVLERHGETADATTKREASLQATYEYLGLNKDGPASFREHDALKVVEWAATV